MNKSGDRRADASHSLNYNDGTFSGWSFHNNLNEKPAGWAKKPWVHSNFRELSYFVYYHRRGHFDDAASRINADLNWSKTPQGLEFWQRAKSEVGQGASRWDVEDLYLEWLGIRKTGAQEFSKDALEQMLVFHNLRDFANAATWLEQAFPWDKTPPDSDTWAEAFTTLNCGNPLSPALLYRLRQMTIDPVKPHYFDVKALPKRIEIRGGMTRFDEIRKPK